jgi:general secretion pathway protein G
MLTPKTFPSRWFKRRRAFSLIELVVVVLILGILAAVAAPRFMSVKDDAVDNGLRFTVRAVREAIDNYAIEHDGEWPAQDGSEATFKSDLRPYLKGSFPTCPVGAMNDQVVISTTGGGSGLSGQAAPAKAWVFNNNKGWFIINYTGVSKDGTPYDQF